MMKLYPLKFKPIPQYRIWGGNELNKVLSEDLHMDKLGEIWSISCLDGFVSEVENGPLKGQNLKELIQNYKGDLMGDKVWTKFQSEFPLLIKFIDAAEPLSVQVHPNDELAKKRHNSFGKTEMWYIIEAKEDAELIIGFQDNMTPESYQNHLENVTLEQVMNKVSVEKGDVLHLPSGRVHAIGAGVILAEIQQASDITYRIYDYNRIDKDGKKRELHTELALDAIDFEPIEKIKTDYTKTHNQLENLLDTPYFESKIFTGDQEIAVVNNEEMKILICTEGQLKIQTESGGIELKKFETALIPASISEYLIIPNKASFIEVKVPIS